MEDFLIYILGWVTFIVGYYISEVYILNYNYNYRKGKVTKKLILYRGVKYGIFSWVAVFFMAAVLVFGRIGYYLFILDNHIEEELNSKG